MVLEGNGNEIAYSVGAERTKIEYADAVWEMENAVLERKYSGARAEGKEVLVLDSVWCKEKAKRQRKYSADIVLDRKYDAALREREI